MRQLRFVVVTLAGVLGVPVLAQDPKPSEFASLEKRIAELSEKIGALQKEHKRLRQELHEKSPITVIPLKFADSGQAAETLEKAYADMPGVLVEALPKMKCVAVRTDTAVNDEVRDFLSRLEEQARPRVGGIRFAPIRLDDISMTVEIIRWLEKKKSAEKTQSNTPKKN